MRSPTETLNWRKFEYVASARIFSGPVYSSIMTSGAHTVSLGTAPYVTVIFAADLRSAIEISLFNTRPDSGSIQKRPRAGRSAFGDRMIVGLDRSLNSRTSA